MKAQPTQSGFTKSHGQTDNSLPQERQKLKVLRTIDRARRAALKTRSLLALENIALRQQLAVLKRKKPRSKLNRIDRIFWVFLSRIFPDWKSCLLIVKPETVIRWHRQGFKYYWRWKSRKPGRPRIDREIITLIHRMSRENPTWGTPRIQSELRLLGHEVAESTVDKYRIKPKKGPSQTWRTFLRNHMHETIACDFFVVPTATFRLLVGLTFLLHQQKANSETDELDLAMAFELSRLAEKGWRRKFVMWGSG